MVIAPAKTGRESRRRIAVRNTDQTKRGRRSQVIPGVRILMIVEMKLIAPRIEETPARWRLKIVRSTEAPEWAVALAKGGYTVHPVPDPLSTRPLNKSNVSEGGRSQNLMLFIRGKAISGAPIIRGTSQFPKPPIMIGMTIKKIMTKACEVTKTLKIWSSPRKLPRCPNSNRIRTLNAVPTIAAQKPKMKYKVPISLWLVENNQRFTKFVTKPSH